MTLHVECALFFSAVWVQVGFVLVDEQELNSTVYRIRQQSPLGVEICLSVTKYTYYIIMLFGL